MLLHRFLTNYRLQLSHCRISGDLDVSLWPADFPCHAPDLWLTGDYFVGKLFVVGHPTRPTQPSIPPDRRGGDQ